MRFCRSHCQVFTARRVTAAFDGGLISSDGGVLLLAGVDKQLGLIDMLAAIIPDHRDPNLITHPMADILRPRVFAIACGYPDANDLDDLRQDPAFKLACGRLPETGVDLTSQPTMSRWENAPDLRTLIRLSHGMVDLWCKSYRRPPKAITLDIDDTADVVHGHQQLSLFNAHYDERCFSADPCLRRRHRPLRAHHPASRQNPRRQGGARPSTPSGAAHTAALAEHRITIRGDSHYGRREAMDWCEENAVRYIFGLSTNETVLAALVFAKTDEVLRPTRDRQSGCGARLRRDPLCRQILVASPPRRGADRGDAERSRYPLCRHQHQHAATAAWLYDGLYCARGQAENLIKRHKSQLASDRTSCRSPLANQMRLILHTAAYWLMRTMRDAIPRQQPLASGEFSTFGCGC